MSLTSNFNLSDFIELPEQPEQPDQDFADMNAEQEQPDSTLALWDIYPPLWKDAQDTPYVDPFQDSNLMEEEHEEAAFRMSMQDRKRKLDRLFQALTLKKEHQVKPYTIPAPAPAPRLLVPERTVRVHRVVFDELYVKPAALVSVQEKMAALDLIPTYEYLLAAL